jgi:hypothetical protein
MPERRTFYARTAVDLLASACYALRFHPEESVVLMSAGETDRPVHGRFDLMPEPAALRDQLEHLVTVAHRNGAPAVVLLVYSADRELAVTVRRLLAEAVRHTGVTVPAALRAHDGRWYPLDDATDPTDPGTPYDLTSHPLVLQAVLEGRVIHGSRRELQGSLVDVDPAQVEAVGRAAEEAMERFRGSLAPSTGEPARTWGRAHLVQEGHWVVDRVRRYLRDGARLSAEDVGRLVAAMVAIEVRDVAWAEMRHDNAARHVELWRDVVRRTPLELRAAPAALLGFAAWLDGNGALAWCAVDRCQEAEPDYSLAGLLSQALAGGVPPSSWKPIDATTLPLFAG